MGLGLSEFGLGSIDSMALCNDKNLYIFQSSQLVMSSSAAPHKNLWEVIQCGQEFCKTRLRPNKEMEYECGLYIYLAFHEQND